MGLPVCVSAKANFHVDFAGIAVMRTRRCVLRRLLLLKHQQMCALESELHLFLLRHLRSTMRVWKKSQIWKISVCYHPDGLSCWCQYLKNGWKASKSSALAFQSCWTTSKKNLFACPPLPPPVSLSKFWHTPCSRPVLRWWSRHAVVYPLLWYCCCGKHMVECEKEDHHRRTGSNRCILRGTPFVWRWLSQISQFDTQALAQNIQLLSTNPFFQHNFSVQFITFGIDWHWLKINFITESKYCLHIAHILSTHC